MGSHQAVTTSRVCSQSVIDCTIPHLAHPVKCTATLDKTPTGASGTWDISAPMPALKGDVQFRSHAKPDRTMDLPNSQNVPKPSAKLSILRIGSVRLHLAWRICGTGVEVFRAFPSLQDPPAQARRISCKSLDKNRNHHYNGPCNRLLQHAHVSSA